MNASSDTTVEQPPTSGSAAAPAAPAAAPAPPAGHQILEHKGTPYVLDEFGKPIDPKTRKPVYIPGAVQETVMDFSKRQAAYFKARGGISSATLDVIAAQAEQIPREGFSRPNIVDNAAVLGYGWDLEGSLLGNFGIVEKGLCGDPTKSLGDLGGKTGPISLLEEDVSGVRGNLTFVIGVASRFRGGVDVTHWGEQNGDTTLHSHITGVATTPFEGTGNNATEKSKSLAEFEKFLAEQRKLFFENDPDKRGDSTFTPVFYPECAHSRLGGNWVRAVVPHKLDTWAAVRDQGFFDPERLNPDRIAMESADREIEIWKRHGRPPRIFRDDAGSLWRQDLNPDGTESGKPVAIVIHVDLDGALAQVSEYDHLTRYRLGMLATELRTGQKTNRDFLKKAAKPLGDKKPKFKAGPGGFLVPVDDNSDPDEPMTAAEEERLIALLISRDEPEAVLVNPLPKAAPEPISVREPAKLIELPPDAAIRRQIDVMDQVEVPKDAIPEGAADCADPLGLPKPTVGLGLRRRLWNLWDGTGDQRVDVVEPPPKQGQRPPPVGKK